MSAVPAAGHPTARPQRLRATPALRRLVGETALTPGDLILPAFVKEGLAEPMAVRAMPGVVQHTRESLRKAAVEAVEAGVGGLMVFGIPGSKDATGSGADAPDGIVQLALADLRSELGDSTVLIADLCMCEYTDHGHCGVFPQRDTIASANASSGTPAPWGDDRLDHAATLERYASIAVSQARAGAHVVAPSGMQDGQVGAIRHALDGAGFGTVPILAYAAKYASVFYGPFREAAESAPQFGDRRTYQMDPGNAVEALREVRLDLQQGADMIMVKPALPYLDVLRRVRDDIDVPVAAYQVSGEMAMVEAAASNGWLDRERAILESLTAIRRAGADMILTYWAVEAAKLLQRAGA